MKWDSLVCIQCWENSDWPLDCRDCQDLLNFLTALTIGTIGSFGLQGLLVVKPYLSQECHWSRTSTIGTPCVSVIVVVLVIARTIRTLKKTYHW